jgi:hypothetical protein
MAENSAENSEIVKIYYGSYRELRDKLVSVLKARPNEYFLTVETTDPVGGIVRYANLDVIKSFLHELETVLIPIEDMENSDREYGPVSFFRGNEY